jgi:hypothetical protein
MSQTWITSLARDVKVGDHIRHRDDEFDVARIDEKFLGVDSMICFIEDTPDRWQAYPATLEAEVQIARLG